MTSDRRRSGEGTTLQRPRFDPTPSADAVFALVVIEGPDTGKAATIDAATRLLVGSSPVCELRLGDREVSRRHVAIESAGRRLRLTDLGSTNGTFVDGVCVIEGFLRGGEIVRMGATAMRVEERAVGAAPLLPVATRFGLTIGASTEMRRLYPVCERLAASDVPAILEGETGTGKEVLAESIHREGPRANGPFVVFDCTAVPPSLVESELFGHERGAFTGAVSSRAGVFEEADGGTLLIDEIGDLDLSLQPKLLRAIERSEVRRVGGSGFKRVHVRVLAATRRDLDAEIARGRFRDDLFHRLAVARVELPPLRRRRGDVAVLARFFCASIGVDPDVVLPPVLIAWEAQAWPGNVRELRNAVARRVAFGDMSAEVERTSGETRTAGPPSESTRDGALERLLGEHLPYAEARRRTLEEFERAYLEGVLARHGGNVTRAAAASGIGRRYFQHLRARKP